MMGEAYFELLLFISAGLVFMVHAMYLTMRDFDAADGDAWMMPVLPLLLFGLGHALFATI